jgi:hypothetical protein
MLILIIVFLATQVIGFAWCGTGAAKDNDMDYHLCYFGDHDDNPMIKSIVNASFFVILVMLVGIVGSIFALVNGQPNDEKDDSG